MVLFFIEIFVYLKWRRNKHQSKFIQRMLRLFKQTNKMQRGNLTVVAEVWMRLCRISIPHAKASTSRLLATSTINKRHWHVSFTVHKKMMGGIKKGNQYFNHLKVINP